jgi:YD repeat-containing protein
MSAACSRRYSKSFGHRASGIGHRASLRRLRKLSVLSSTCLVAIGSFVYVGSEASVAQTLGPTISTFAGSIEGQSGSVDGSGLAARFFSPTGLAFDSGGNLFVADYYGHKIRKITNLGMVSTFAGSGVAGYAEGSGGAAQFDFPNGIAVDVFGNVFVGDVKNNRIRKITPLGVVSTFAGSAVEGFENGIGSQARFRSPAGLAFTPTGDLLVADIGNHSIRKISPTGIVSTFAGTGLPGFADGQSATALFKYPQGVAVDPAGQVFVSDGGNARIRKISAAGIVSTVAGSGVSGNLDGQGGNAQFGFPQGIVIDRSENLYVADSTNSNIRKISPNGTVSIFTGFLQPGTPIDGPVLGSFVYQPVGLAYGPSGDLYVSEYSGHRIRRIYFPEFNVPTTTTTTTTTSTAQPSTTTTTTTTTIPGAAPVKAVRVLGVSIFADATAKSGIVGTFADPVNGATGAFTHEVQDVSAVSKGVEFSMGRLYDSKATKASPLGTAWGSKLFESIALSTDPAAIPGTLVWKSGTGTEAEFAPDGSGGFVTPPGSLGVVKATAGGGWEYVSGTQVVTRFDLAGRKVSSLDRSGQGLTYTYDLAGKLTTVTDATGQSTLLAYGTAASNPNKDLLIKVTTSDGRIVKYGYTANLGGKTRLTSVTDVRNKISTYTYDAQGLLISETDPVGNKPFVNSYDAQGRVVWQDDPLGKRSTFAYNDAQQITTMTDAAGAVQSQDYSGNVLGTVSTPAGSSVIVRNSALDVTSYTDASGKSWAAQYDARGNMTSRTGPTGLVETWTYDAGNNVLTQTDTTGVQTSYGTTLRVWWYLK